MNIVQLEPAYLLHSRPYRNSSLIVDLFTANHGRISAVAKGIKSNKSPSRHHLQAFQPLLISWQGRSEMVTLTKIEIDTPFALLAGKKLVWGFYLNELLYRLLEKHDPHADLFVDYHMLIAKLTENIAAEQHLRLFERNLLAALGYGLQLTKQHNNKIIEPHATYYYSYEYGPTLSNNDTNPSHHYQGSSLLALAEGHFPDVKSLQDAKRLLRGAIQKLLGNKVLYSRELIRG